MANWACLPHDLLVFTAGLLKKFEDFAAFGAVCKSWHAAANKDYFKELWLRECTPYLLLPARRTGNDYIRDFYSLSEGDTVASIRVRNSSKTKCFESLGWFLAVDEDGSMCLLDPFSKVEIPLPHQSTLPNAKCSEPQEIVRKMVLSARPGESSNFIVAIIYRSFSDLAFWRPGETSWYRIKKEKGYYQDVTYHSGHFYSLDSLSRIRIYNFALGNPLEGQVIARLVPDRNSRVPLKVIARPVPDRNSRVPLLGQCYLGESRSIYLTKTDEGSLLLVSRKYDEEEYDEEDSDEEDYGEHCIKTIKFQVYEFDFQLSKWREINNLGNMAIFVSNVNATTAVDASRFHGVIKPNHIYFMDDGSPYDGDCHLDRGTYNMENGTIDPFYHEEEFHSKISRPTWFIPILWPLSC